MIFLDGPDMGVTDPNSPTTTVSMVEDRNLTANFYNQTFTLSVSINGQGSITGAGNFNYDDLPTISAPRLVIVS